VTENVTVWCVLCVCVLQGDELFVMPEEGLPHPDEQELMSNDEAHDQLGDLPFHGGELD